MWEAEAELMDEIIWTVDLRDTRYLLLATM
jgi:hypothetical protein